MSGLPPPAPGCASCAARDAEIAALRAQLAELGERVARMERAASRNSGNSSMPPSSDDLPGRRPPRKQRRAAARGQAQAREAAGCVLCSLFTSARLAPAGTSGHLPVTLSSIPSRRISLSAHRVSVYQASK